MQKMDHLASMNAQLNSSVTKSGYFLNKTMDTNEKNIKHKRKLKIGLLSTRFFGVPPLSYSGLEQVVWDLAYALDKLGHEVTVFAPKGSLAPPHGRLVEIGEAIQSCKINWLKAELEAYDCIKDESENLDILNGHNWFGVEYLKKVTNENLPVAHTHHGLNVSWLNFFKPLFSLNLISISDWTKEIFAQQGFVAHRCYNGVDLDKYAFSAKKGDRFMFLGRIAKSKGPHTAIRVAREAGIGLDIIGSTSFVRDMKYVDEICRLCDGEKSSPELTFLCLQPTFSLNF